MVPGSEAARTIPTSSRSVPFLQKESAKEQSDFDTASKQQSLGDYGKRMEFRKERGQRSGSSDA
jgi:hypothetical protein